MPKAWFTFQCLGFIEYTYSCIWIIEKFKVYSFMAIMIFVTKNKPSQNNSLIITAIWRKSHLFFMNQHFIITYLSLRTHVLIMFYTIYTVQCCPESSRKCKFWDMYLILGQFATHVLFIQNIQWGKSFCWRFRGHAFTCLKPSSLSWAHIHGRQSANLTFYNLMSLIP